MEDDLHRFHLFYDVTKDCKISLSN